MTYETKCTWDTNCVYDMEFDANVWATNLEKKKLFLLIDISAPFKSYIGLPFRHTIIYDKR